MGFVDKVAAERYNEISEKYAKASKFRPFIFAPSREEMHRTIYRCVDMYWDSLEVAKAMLPKKKRDRRRRAAAAASSAAGQKAIDARRLLK